VIYLPKKGGGYHNRGVFMKNTKNKCAKMRGFLAVQIRWISVIALIAVIGFSMLACPVEEEEEDEPVVDLKGTWVDDDPDMNGAPKYKFDNGNWGYEWSNEVDGEFKVQPFYKGTYTISGNKLTLRITHIYGGSLVGVLYGLTDDTKWYNKEEFADTATVFLSSPPEPLSAEDVEDIFGPTIYTFSVNGNKLTMTTKNKNTGEDKTNKYTKI
jgi:hypothetical protein